MKRPLLGLFGNAAQVHPWQPADHIYPPLAGVDPKALAGQSGLYALWHLGIRPRWIRVGGAADLGEAIMHLKKIPEILAAAAHGGVYVAWAPQSVAAIPAAIAFLATDLKPFLQTLVIAGEVSAGAAPATSFPFPPGTQIVPTVSA